MNAFFGMLPFHRVKRRQGDVNFEGGDIASAVCFLRHAMVVQLFTPRILRCRISCRCHTKITRGAITPGVANGADYFSGRAMRLVDWRYDFCFWAVW